MTTTYFIRLQLTEPSNKVLSQNFYWYSTTPDLTRQPWQMVPLQDEYIRQYDFLADAAHDHGHVHGYNRHTNSVATTLTNSSTSLAFQIRARVTDASGNEILPVWWTDNYISLLLGESRTLTANYFNNAPVPAGTKVQLDGFNIDPN